MDWKIQNDWFTNTNILLHKSSYIKMAVVECDLHDQQLLASVMFVCCTCMATCLSLREVLLQLFPVQYYTCFVNTLQSLKSAY